MYIGMRGHDFDTNTLDALCEKCKEYGVGGVQLVLLRSLADFKKGNFTPEYAKSIGDKLRENGIRVPILGCYINPSDANEESLNESLDYFIENLHYAKYIGAEMVGLETCRFSDDDEINNSEETYQYLLKNMKKLVSAAEEIGVNVGIEGVHFHVINDPVNYINTANYKNQDEIINTHFDLLGEKTKLLHLKDFKLVDGEVAYEFPCDGLLNKDLLWDKLKQYNPDIAVILEEVKEDHLAQVKAAVEKRFV